MKLLVFTERKQGHFCAIVKDEDIEEFIEKQNSSEILLAICDYNEDVIIQDKYCGIVYYNIDIKDVHHKNGMDWEEVIECDRED